MDFWNNLGVNLLSNAVWVVLAFGIAQFIRHVTAKEVVAAPAHAGTSNPSLTPRETRVNVIRRVLRCTFAFGGLLVVVLVICATFADSIYAWAHALGWCGVIGTWLVWSWSIRDAQAALAQPIKVRVAWAVVAAGFWVVLLSGLIVAVYGAP